mgnify:CR=1 FL=1|jgi:hypothetical protein
MKNVIIAAACGVMFVLFMQYIMPLTGYDPAPRYTTLVQQ